MNKEDALEFTQGLGQVIGGSWRIVASAKRIGVPQALDVTTEQWVNETLGGYIKLSVEERRRAVQELSLEGHSNVQIGEILGVAETTVRRDAASANVESNKQKDNEINNVENGTSTNVESKPLDAITGLTPSGTQTILSSFTGNNEWYTPLEWIERARETMGSIDLDPASNEYAQQKIKAGTWFDAQRDGLVQPWFGNVWLNPPYGRGLIDDFVEKTISEYSVKHTNQAIVLVDPRTDTEWFHSLGSIAAAIAFTRGRICFYNKAVDTPSSPTNGSVFFYIGPRIDSFLSGFGGSCLVLKTSAL